MNPNDASETSAETNSLIDEIKALRDSTEELFILLEHIWQNREELRNKASIVLTGRGPEAAGESLYCYECETASPDSLAQALRNGWADVQYEPEDEAGANFCGWCPGCQVAHEDEERRLNEDRQRPLLGMTTDESAAQVPPRAKINAADPSEGLQIKMPAEPRGTSLPEAASTDPTGSMMAPEPGEAISPPSEGQRKRNPLYLRLYLHRHLEEIVRAIGYDAIPLEEVQHRLEPLIERYGRDTIDPAAEELLAVDTSRTDAHVQLKREVRKLAWQILGPPRDTRYDSSAGHVEATQKVVEGVLDRGL